jgi:hypothetical protein
MEWVIIDRWDSMYKKFMAIQILFAQAALG